MEYEVEVKYRVDSFAPLEQALALLGAAIGPVIDQVDQYWSHPSRDFGVTDEAFRLRTTGSRNALTYKGPRLDSHSKTRQELELALPDGEPYGQRFHQLLELLGFQPLLPVRKCRRKAFVAWEQATVEVSLDEVDQVGRFVELELVVEEAGLEDAQQRLAGLAARLGLRSEAAERRSYLELLRQHCS